MLYASEACNATLTGTARSDGVIGADLRVLQGW